MLCSRRSCRTGSRRSAQRGPPPRSREPDPRSREPDPPIAEGAHRHSAPQALEPGAPASALTGRHRQRRRQPAVDRRGAHRQEPLAHSGVEAQVAVLLEGRDQGRQQRLQSLPAHPVRRLPQDDQPLRHGRVVHAGPPASCTRPGCRPIEDSDRMLAVVPGESDELIEDQPLLGCRTLPISLHHRRHQLLPCSRTDHRHRASFGSKSIVRQRWSSGSTSGESMRRPE